MDATTSRQKAIPRQRRPEPEPEVPAAVQTPAVQAPAVQAQAVQAPQGAESSGALAVADAIVGASAVAVRWGRRSTQLGARLLAPAAPVVLRAVRPALEGGRRQRETVTAALRDAWQAVVPRVLDAVLDEVDLTDLVAKRVDLDALARRLDLDAAVARVDVDAVVARVDLEPIIERLPIDEVLARVDLDEVAARLDIDAVLDRVDLIELARYVIDGVDLPEIIRESTGSMASEGIRGVRMQSIEADERFNRLVDRALLRRRGRRTDAPTQAGLPEGGAT